MADLSVGDPLSMHDPRMVGPWTIHSRLGAGGMGVVFFATCEDQHAAIKVIRPGLLDTPSTRDRFRREVAVLRSVRDDHICRFLDADLDSEPAWLALEYLSGPVLRDQVLSAGPLPADQWWDLARGLAQALSVLEANRVTHRDLKPGNVILNPRGPVLIDFGIAHPEDATALTATGLVTGSPAWLSPEQANLDPTGPATDIFSLGSLLAFSATGRPPFGEGASVAVLMSIIKREPDLDGIDPVRAGLLRRLLAKDPAARPTAAEVMVLTDQSRSVADTFAGSFGPAAPTTGDFPTRSTRPDLAPAIPPVAASPAQPAAPAPWAYPAAASMASADQAVPVRTPAPPPPRTAGPRSPGPRTTAARQRRARRRRVLLGLLVVAALIAVVVWGVSTTRSTSTGSGSDGSAGTSQGSGDTPPAPSKDSLASGDWVLMSYRLDNTTDGLVVSGTVRNKSDTASSADLTVWVYLDTTSLGSVSTTVTNVAAGATVPVTMTGDAVWKPGQKVVLLQADPI